MVIFVGCLSNLGAGYQLFRGLEHTKFRKRSQIMSPRLEVPEDPVSRISPRDAIEVKVFRLE